MKSRASPDDSRIAALDPVRRGHSQHGRRSNRSYVIAFMSGSRKGVDDQIGPTAVWFALERTDGSHDPAAVRAESQAARIHP